LSRQNPLRSGVQKLATASAMRSLMPLWIPQYRRAMASHFAPRDQKGRGRSGILESRTERSQDALRAEQLRIAFLESVRAARSGALASRITLPDDARSVDGAAKYKRIPMATPNTLSNGTRAAVAFLDGRCVKGYLYNFSAQKDHVLLFFRAGHRPARRHGSPGEGLESKFLCPGFRWQWRILRISGRRYLSRRRKAGGNCGRLQTAKMRIFPSPADPRSNNLRVFVINQKRDANSLDLIFLLLTPPSALLFSGPNAVLLPTAMRYKSRRP
jgi:hypothetical protein